MALETGDYFTDLVITNPTSSDPKSAGDDHFRLVKKVIKECINGFSGGVLLTATESGTASAHVLTPTTALVGYTTGLMLLYRPTNAGTGALTVNVSALGAKNVKTISGADPTSGDILVNQPVLLVYDGTNFVLLAGSEYLSKTGNQTLTGNLTLTGSETVSGTLGVTGASTLTGDIGGTGGDKKANRGGETYTGTHAFAGATSVTVPTPTTSTQAVTKAYADGLSLSAALPAQTGNSGKFITTDGSTASWAAVGITRSTRTSNTILAAADNRAFIDITSGTFSQTFTAVATLADGWYCYLRNSGTGLITLDPNASETIDGLTSYIMYPGECRLVMCTGAALISTVLTPFNYTTTATVTFTTPPGYALFGGLLWGGGGGGGYGAAGYITGGGGGGACVPFTLTAAQLGTSKTITIGAGGASVSAAGPGGVGGTSDIGTTLATAYGGGGGGGDAGASAYAGGGGGAFGAGASGTTSGGGVGGFPRVGDSTNSFCVSNQGFGGSKGGESTSTGVCDSGWGGAGGGVHASTVVAGKSIYGGGGGGGIGSANGDGAVGGTSMFGGAGGAASVAGVGVAGSVPGGGGGATHSGANSGAGGAGQCKIWGIV